MEIVLECYLVSWRPQTRGRDGSVFTWAHNSSTLVNHLPWCSSTLFLTSCNVAFSCWSQILPVQCTIGSHHVLWESQAASLQEPVLNTITTFQKRYKVFTDAMVRWIDIAQDYCKLLFVWRISHLITIRLKYFASTLMRSLWECTQGLESPVLDIR